MSINSFVPLFVIFGVLALMLASVFVTRKLMIRRDRQSPIKQDMLRGPGHALRERIDDLVWDVGANLALGPLIPLAMYAMYLQHRLAMRTAFVKSARFSAACWSLSCGYSSVRAARSPSRKASSADRGA